ncbi:MAG: winged helix-turn-helix domain-containing protein [Candidatus Asgardarchaeum sp.]
MNEDYLKLKVPDLIPDKMSVMLPDQRTFLLNVLKAFPISPDDFIIMPQKTFQELIDKYLESFPETKEMDTISKFKFLAKKIGIPYRRVERYYYSAFKTPKRLRRILLKRAIELTKLSEEDLKKYGTIKGEYIYFDQEVFKKLIDKRIEEEFPNLSKRKALKMIAEKSNLSLNTIILYYYQYFKDDTIKRQRGIRIDIAQKLTGLPIEELIKYGTVTLNLRPRAKKLAEILGVSEETIILFWLRDHESPSFSHMKFNNFVKCCEIAGISLEEIWPQIKIGIGKKFAKLPFYLTFNEKMAEVCGMFYLSKIRGGHIVLTNTSKEIHKLGLERLKVFDVSPEDVNFYLHIPPHHIKSKEDIEKIKQEWISELGLLPENVTIITKGLHFTKKIAGQMVIYLTPQAYILSNIISKIPELLDKSPDSVKKAFLRGYTDIKGTISQSVIVLTIGKDVKKARFVNKLLNSLGYESKVVVNKHKVAVQLNPGEQKNANTRTLNCIISAEIFDGKLKIHLENYHNLTKNPYPVDFAVVRLLKNGNVIYEKMFKINDTTKDIEITEYDGDKNILIDIEILKIMQYQIRLTKESSIRFIEDIDIQNKEFVEKVKEALSGKLLTKISNTILEIIRENPGITASEIAKKLDKHVVYIRQKLNILVKNGLIKTNNMKPYRYYLVNNPHSIS